MAQSTSSTGNQPLIELRHVDKHYGDLHVLNDINLSVDRGEVVCIIGASGSGKSTLLRCINLLEEADSGHIWFDGQDLMDLKVDLNALRQKIGMVFQGFNLFNNKSVLDNCTLAPMTVRHIPRAQAEETAIRHLKAVGLEDFIHADSRRLSGGQKQRVAIARALMRKPALLLADEPVASLDPVTGRQILALLQDISRTEGVTILMNSHNLDQSRAVSSRLLGLHAGQIVLDCAPDAVTDADLARIYGGAESEAAP